MDNLTFRTEDGYLYDEGKHYVMVNHKAGGYRKDKIGNEGEFMFSCLEDGSSEEQKLFGRIREILRMADSFKEKVSE